MSEISMNFDSMKISVREITLALETVAPPALQESYDNSGLIVGSQDDIVKKALLSLDCTPAIVEEAIHEGCDMIIAHHPIVFKGLKRFNGKNYVEKAVMLAIKHDIALYACHTNLDNVLHNGVNAKIAEKLGLINTKIMSPKGGLLLKLGVHVPMDHLSIIEAAMFKHGAGNIGNYSECGFSWDGKGSFTPNNAAKPFIGSANEQIEGLEKRIEVIVPEYYLSSVLGAMKEAHPYEEVAYDVVQLKNNWQEVGSGMIGELPSPVSMSEFIEMVKTKMELNHFKGTKSNRIEIKKVGVCGGAGSFLIPQAMANGCDAYITSDVKYHEFFDTEGGMFLCDIGHYESEKYTIPLFKEILSEKFPNFATIFAQTETNPVQYH